MLSLAACGTDNESKDSVDDNNNSSDVTLRKKSYTAAEEIDAAFLQQEVRIISTEYVVQDKRYKSLYPDLLQVVIKNDSQYDLKNVVVAFVAWDENNLPVKIKGKYDYGSKTSYIKKCNYEDINLIPGDTFGDDVGMALSSECDTIDKFKAIVVSYEGFDGEEWTNPLYEDWVKIYEGKRYS